MHCKSLVQKLLTFFNKKYWHISDINVGNFNETLTNDVVSFEQPGLIVLSENAACSQEAEESAGYSKCHKVDSIFSSAVFEENVKVLS